MIICIYTHTYYCIFLPHGGTRNGKMTHFYTSKSIHFEQNEILSVSSGAAMATIFISRVRAFSVFAKSQNSNNIYILLPIQYILYQTLYSLCSQIYSHIIILIKCYYFIFLFLYIPSIIQFIYLNYIKFKYYIIVIYHNMI